MAKSPVIIPLLKKSIVRFIDSLIFYSIIVTLRMLAYDGSDGCPRPFGCHKRVWWINRGM